MSKVYLFGISLLLVQGMVQGNNPNEDEQFEAAVALFKWCINDWKDVQFQVGAAPEKNEVVSRRVSIKGAEAYQNQVNAALSWKRDYRIKKIEEMVKEWRKTDLVEHINNTPLDENGAKLTHILTKEGLAKSLTGVCKLPEVNLWVQDNNGLSLEEYSKIPSSKHTTHPMCLSVVQRARVKRKEKFDAIV